VVDSAQCPGKCTAEFVLMRRTWGRIVCAPIGALLCVSLTVSGCTSPKKPTPKPVAEVSAAVVTEFVPEEELELTFDSAALPVSTEVRLITKGTLTACVAPPYPPFLYSKQSDGEDLSGIDVDVVTAIATNNKLTPAFVETPFEGIFEALTKQKCDVIAAAIPITNSRKRTHEFTTPYFRMSQSLLVRTGQLSTSTSLETLRGKVVGVQRSTIGSELLRIDSTKLGLTVKEFAGRFEMLEALKTNAIEAIVGDSALNGFDAEESNGTFVVSSLIGGGDEEYAMVVDPTNPILTKTLNSSLARMAERDLLRKIAVRYIGRRAVAPLIAKP
jgi:polar amino acid transport system substrate-binding protein